MSDGSGRQSIDVICEGNLDLLLHLAYEEVEIGGDCQIFFGVQVLSQLSLDFHYNQTPFIWKKPVPQFCLKASFDMIYSQQTSDSVTTNEQRYNERSSYLADRTLLREYSVKDKMVNPLEG